MSKQIFAKKFYKRADVFLGAVVVILIGYITLVLFKQNSSRRQIEVSASEASKVAQYQSALDGSAANSQAERYPQVVGVMVDNHPDARPQTGIENAAVIYEAPVEGGFTRYFAIYPASSTVEKVGPVRSARPYFLDWLSEYGDGLYEHSGGSPEALALIKHSKYFDANEFWFGDYYWRDKNQSPPHNLYTNSERWQALLAKYGRAREKKSWEGWNFSDQVQASGTIKALIITYSSDYKVGWAYNDKERKFERSVGGVLSSAASGKIIAADNVIVEEMPVKIIDEEGRKEIVTVGSGSARILRRGTMVRGTWKKAAPNSRTRFYDENNQEITLVPGNTWVEIVQSPANIIITQ